MRARKPWQPTKGQTKAMLDEIKRQVVIADQTHYLDTVALVLWALHTHKATRYGKKRLKAFFKDFDKIHRELLNYYELPDQDAPWLVHRMLKEIGVDINEWCKEVTE